MVFFSPSLLVGGWGKIPCLLHSGYYAIPTLRCNTI
jgi:hypothetical protein